MKFIKHIFSLSVLLGMLGSFSQCSSVKQLETKAPMNFGKAYFQKWIAGIQGGGSGINLVIPVSEHTTSLDSVYFRGMRTKLEWTNTTSPKTYIGRFKTALNQKTDMIISSNPKDEFKNKVPEAIDPIPFDLKPSECVVSYTHKGKTKYYKITGIIEKDLIAFPNALPKTH
ncbi:MAG: hypothetical protein HRT67_13560 [Flavobacteriaceae bacterium]|nr:hypothetical protein [Flavobacteriaceae bacterium]